MWSVCVSTLLGVRDIVRAREEQTGKLGICCKGRERLVN